MATLIRAAVITASVVFLTGCFPDGPLKTPDVSAAIASGAKTKEHVTAAKTDINQVLKDNAIIARPDLEAKLRDAEDNLTVANATIDSQSQDLEIRQKEIDKVTEEGNAAIAAKDAMEPKHKRDIQALVYVWVLCSLACILGPLIFKAYPALVFFPTSLEAVVCSFAAFCLCSGVVALLLVFGVL